jgi:hypothetical protein
MQPGRGEERREFQRLELEPPITGTFGTTAVSIVEIGVLGARLHHGDVLAETYSELRFAHRGEDVGLRCEVVRTTPSQDERYPGAGLESGVRFLAAVGESGDRLRNMLAELVTKIIDARGRGPMKATGETSIDGDRTVRGADAGFLCYRLDNGVWRRRRVFLPEQPSSGFTVARGEDHAEMQRLCRVYEASDEEGRRLIRLFAELSVSEQLQIPPTA